MIGEHQVCTIDVLSRIIRLFLDAPSDWLSLETGRVWIVLKGDKKHV